MANTARSLALTALLRCRRDNAFSDSLLPELLRDSGLNASDRALVSKLCYGVLQNTMLLDFYIDIFSDGKKLEPKLRDLLRLSMYQILLLDKVPDYAAVNESVELSRAIGLGRASGLVNAILRRAIRSRDELPEIPKENISYYLSVKYSTPEALVNEFIDLFGADFTQALLDANNKQAPLTIQTNALKTTAAQLIELLDKDGIASYPHEFIPNALNISSAGRLFEGDAFHDGLFYVQDAAAALSILAAAPEPGQSVLDACAAPGGKSFTSAIRMNNSGSITSCDIHENKLNRVKQSASSLGIDIITAKLLDATVRSSELIEAFDLVIADAPCSGLGVIRKKPDIRYRNIESLKALPELQRRILDNTSAYVKPGGTLLYSTCTILKRENEDVVSAFLKEHTEFSLEAFALPEPLGRIDKGMLTLYPHIHNTDGFFICKMRKQI